MEDQTADGVESGEEFSAIFRCCVCLDLLYKPIVLSCGHISCFWCVYRSMNGLRESHCPICRHSYTYFPTICQMLHFLLLKMYPVAYKRRENQILGEEKKTGSFSPQFDPHLCGSRTQESNHLDYPSHSFTAVSPFNSGSDPWFNKKGEPCANVEQSESVSMFNDNGTILPQQNCNRNFEVTGSIDIEEESLSHNNFDGNCKVLIADVLCSVCNQLLFQPVVLNCGHVYCQTCIINPMDKKLKCHVCQCLHPSGFSKVCLELDHFLEEQFPGEYAMRRDAVQLEQIHFQHKSPTTCSTKSGEEYIPWWSSNGTKVHMRVGCDSCGMYPIIGDRYKCKDCVEAIGFDFCGDCYNTRSKLPGRFNQQHTPEHRFELVKSSIMGNIMLRLVTGQLGGGSAASILSSYVSENPQALSPTTTLLVDAQQNDENDLDAPVAFDDTLDGPRDI